MTNLMIFANVSTWSFHQGIASFFGEENMRSSSASSLDLIVESHFRMCAEDHVSRATENIISRVTVTVIQNLVDGFICALCGRSLLSDHDISVATVRMNWEAARLVSIQFTDGGHMNVKFF